MEGSVTLSGDSGSISVATTLSDISSICEGNYVPNRTALLSNVTTSVLSEGKSDICGAFLSASTSRNTENLDIWGKIDCMLDTMNDIQKIYKFIDIQSEDIFITIAKTGEILSLNKLISDNARLSEENSLLKK